MANNELSSDDQNDNTDAGSGQQWWVTAGPEYCFACEAPAHAEGLAYCITCDQAVCPLCSQNSSDLVGILCPECAAEERGDQR